MKAIVALCESPEGRAPGDGIISDFMILWSACPLHLVDKVIIRRTMKLLYSFAFVKILKAEENTPTIRVTKIAHLDITVNGEPQE